jgi:hypothetical protein
MRISQTWTPLVSGSDTWFSRVQAQANQARCGDGLCDRALNRQAVRLLSESKPLHAGGNDRSLLRMVLVRVILRLAGATDCTNRIR